MIIVKYQFERDKENFLKENNISGNKFFGMPILFVNNGSVSNVDVQIINF